MTHEERIEQLEARLDQVQKVNEMLFNLTFRILSDDMMSAALTTREDISDWIRVMAGGREDQGDHISAHLLERISDLLKK